MLIKSVDYNSWIESDQGLALAASLDKDVILAEGIVNSHLASQATDDLQATRSTRLEESTWQRWEIGEKTTRRRLNWMALVE